MNSGERWRLGHRPALDGLRGVAIMLVLLGHITNGWLVNFGAVGVAVFFGLSGFLITALLLDEQETSGRVRLGAFYLRRARRLLPALGVYLLIWLGLGWAGVGPFRYTFSVVAMVVLYAGNWLMAAHVAVPHPLSITWSLAIEEQFYLLWPLALLGARRWHRLPATLAALGVVYAVAMRWAAWDGGDSIYYRSDTRMDSLLVGCLLALAVKRGLGPAAWWRWLTIVGVGLCALALSWATPTGHDLGVPVLVGLGTVALIGSVLAGDLAWLSWSPLRWLGRRSYALYLWHYPLASLAWAGTIPMWVAVVLALVASEASWWLVERPLRVRRPHGSVRVPERAVSPSDLGFQGT